MGLRNMYESRNALRSCNVNFEIGWNTASHYGFQVTCSYTCRNMYPKVQWLRGVDSKAVVGGIK